MVHAGPLIQRLTLGRAETRIPAEKIDPLRTQVERTSNMKHDNIKHEIPLPESIFSGMQIDRPPSPRHFPMESHTIKGPLGDRR